MKPSRIIFWIIILAVVLRLASLGTVLMYGSGEKVLVEDDAVGYMELATNLAHGNGYISHNPVTGELGTEVFRSAGLPLLLTPFTFLPHSAVWWGIFMSILAGGLLPLLTYMIGVRLFNSNVALLAALLTAIEPHMVWFSWLPLTEMPFIIFSLVGLWLILLEDSGKWYWRIFLAGLLLGYAILIRPPFLFILVVAIFVSVVYWIYTKRISEMKKSLILVVGIVLTLLPWSIRNHVVTGNYSVSGMGWYNIYADYLPSVLSVENNTSFSYEKDRLRENPPAGMTKADLMDPTYSEILRDISLSELWQHRLTVLKLEPALFLSFLTNDGYFYYLEGLGLLPRASEKGLEHSVTFSLISQGKTGFSQLIHELKRQFGIPLIGRIFTLAVVILAVIGLVSIGSAWAGLLYLVVVLFGLVSTAVGLGVQARLRVPVEPILFILASAGVFSILSLDSFSPVKRFIKEHGLQVARFCLSGGTAALVGVLSLYILTDIFGIWYLISGFLSFLAATISAFVLQKFWTFKEHSRHRIKVQTVQTIALATFNLILNIVLLYVLVDFAGMNYIVVQCLIYAVIGALDFFIYRQIIFKLE